MAFNGILRAHYNYDEQQLELWSGDTEDCNLDHEHLLVAIDIPKAVKAKSVYDGGGIIDDPETVSIG